MPGPKQSWHVMETPCLATSRKCWQRCGTSFCIACDFRFSRHVSLLVYHVNMQEYMRARAHMYTYVCMYVSRSKLVISKEFSEPVPGGPVVASVPKCHESREKVKPEWEAKFRMEGIILQHWKGWKHCESWLEIFPCSHPKGICRSCTFSCRSWGWKRICSPNWNHWDPSIVTWLFSSMITYDNIYVWIFVSTSTNTYDTEPHCHQLYPWMPLTSQPFFFQGDTGVLERLLGDRSGNRLIEARYIFPHELFKDLNKIIIRIEFDSIILWF